MRLFRSNVERPLLWDAARWLRILFFLLTSAGRFVPSSSPLPLFLHLSERNSEMSSMTSRPVSLRNSRGAAALIPYLQAREPCPTKRKRFVRMGETNRKDRSDTIRRSRNYFAEKLGSLRRRIKWVAARVHSLCQIEISLKRIALRKRYSVKLETHRI